jgi:hypothetical protein
MCCHSWDSFTLTQKFNIGRFFNTIFSYFEKNKKTLVLVRCKAEKLKGIDHKMGYLYGFLVTR